MDDLRGSLKISPQSVEEINEFLTKDGNPLVDGLTKIVEKYGGVEEINRRAEESGNVDSLLGRLEEANPGFCKDLRWLMDARDDGAFIGVDEYRRNVLGGGAESAAFDESLAVTLEISACNFFPFMVEEAKKAIAEGSLMPARYIRVRAMKEQVEDGDIDAFTAATKVIGATYVQTLDNKGTLPGPDGAPINVHLGGPETITGYFGGVGVPNRYALSWADELLHYYTVHGVGEVLNINPGTVTLGYLLYKMGVDVRFKISVYMGNDNPYSALWTLIGAKMFSREDGSTPLIGFNLSNSVDNWTLEESGYVRDSLGLEATRLEHHITETWKSIVRQPYDRLDELVEVAARVANISAKHEGGIPGVEETREHPSDIMDYFMSKKDIEAKGLMPALTRNYLDKHDSVNRTARVLTENGLAVLAAWNLHR
ncbi:hypothetical protein JXL21_13275 [Candidatus Bathyarchaeota archaeon]|nr:hypothetical protein [Candidatus Bathyarchaeota archaeon]